MANLVHCTTHGEQQPTYVCAHLAEDASGLGFNHDEPDKDKPFPDAWCDDCELIRSAHNGWTEASEKLVTISLLCSRCYERSRVRNTKTSFTLDRLADMRWKCGTCEEWHTGPCLDYGYQAPHYWSDKTGSRVPSIPDFGDELRKNFLSPDYCVLGDKYFFVRGLIRVPIIGSAEYLNWGVWGSLSRENFETLLRMEQDPKRMELPSMFSWLSSRISEYPEPLNLKMQAHVQRPGMRPHFELEETDHPLSREQRHGIKPERVKEIMIQRLRDAS
jgi:hypothetical protein